MRLSPYVVAVGVAATLLASRGVALAKHGTRAKLVTPGSTGKASADDEALHRVKGGAHFDVVAHDLRLSDARAGKLEHIATRYFEATHRKLTITGGTRSATTQAKLMIEKLDHGDDLKALYPEATALGEIIGAYKDGKAHKASKSAIERAVREKIEAQMKRGVMISRHLKSGAVDVRSFGMSPTQAAAFKAAVGKEPGVILLDERTAAEQHFHLSL